MSFLRRINRYVASAACFLALILAGCSDEDCTPCAPVVTEQPLAQFDHIWSGLTATEIGDTLRINFVSSSSDTLFDLYVTEADNNTAKIFNARSYPPFIEAAARLSDGVDDQWKFWFRSLLGEYGGGPETSESGWLEGGFMGEYNPDLLGAEITKIWLFIDRVSIYRQGDFTTYHIAVRVFIMGKP